MKAAVLSGYDRNGADLVVKDVAEPECGPGDVLVKIVAADVNPLDNMIIRKEVSLIVGYDMPLVMGNELSGVVERVGDAVVGFASGDRVYARLPLGRIGAFAEYAAIDHHALAKIPDYLSFEQAAAVPLTALTAMQALDLLDASEGDTLFISGGTGSFGAVAIPIAVARGLRVVTSGSAANEERVRALGASDFIDYRKRDYADVLRDVDCVIDTLGDKELPREFGVLKRGGSLVSLRGLPNGEFARRTGMGFLKRLMFGAAGSKYDRLASKRGQRYRFVFVHSDGAQLAEASDILASARIEPSVDKVFPLDDVNAALAKVAAGGSVGKTILEIG